MWSYPSISPVALDIGFIQIHWYGLMYLFGFAAFYVLANRRVNRLIEGQDDFVLMCWRITDFCAPMVPIG